MDIQRKKKQKKQLVRERKSDAQYKQRMRAHLSLHANSPRYLSCTSQGHLLKTEINQQVKTK